MNKIVILTICIIGISFASCEKEQNQTVESNQLLVDFEFTIEGDCSTPSLEVIFENKSSSAGPYHWDFGDGTSSTLENPKKVYSKSGTYLTKLTVVHSGKSVHTQKELTLTRNSDGTGPLAKFSTNRNSPLSLTIDFTIENSGATYILYFGDETHVEVDQPTIKHTYSGKGIYTARLVAKNNDGQNCSIATIDLSK